MAATGLLDITELIVIILDVQNLPPAFLFRLNSAGAEAAIFIRLTPIDSYFRLVLWQFLVMIDSNWQLQTIF